MSILHSIRERWCRCEESSRDAVARYGLLTVFIVALPAMVYFDATLLYRRHLAVSSFRSDWAAVRTDDGPGIPPPPVVFDTVPHVSTPAMVKGLYVTCDGYSSSKVLNPVLDLARSSEINALVIDLKNHKFELCFKSDNPEFAATTARNASLGHLKDLTARLHEDNLYLIARISTFQDTAFATVHPEYAIKHEGGGLWKDNRGLLWLDPAAKPVWDYNVAIATEAWEAGFDEIQFDYIRFASDGKLKSMRFPVWDGVTPKHEVINSFFAHLDSELRQKRGIPISADLFGLTMWHHDDDMNIGQLLKDALPHFDAISPMVYPSHYPPGFMGFANPAEHPYEIILENMKRGNQLIERLKSEAAAAGAPEPKLASIRPWLQDFNLGAKYTGPMIRAQVKASEEEGAGGWLIWNAGNKYTRDGVLKE